MGTARKLAFARQWLLKAEHAESPRAPDLPASDLRLDDLLLCHRLALDFGMEAALQALKQLRVERET